MDLYNYLRQYPDDRGYFKEYGGAFLEEKLIPAFEEITQAYQAICHSSQFISELRRIRKEFQGRPTPVYHCERLSASIGDDTCQIYLKREDLNHTGAHKLNHCMGEGLLAKYMGKKKLIAETGAGQHGVALATAAAYFGLSRLEGIIPAIESAHAVAYAMKLAKERKKGALLVTLSGRGDKDIDYVVENYGYGEKFL